MDKYMIAYHGGSQPASQEEGMAMMQKWKDWVASLGEQVVNPGTPLPSTKVVTASGVADDTDKNTINGFAVVLADSMDEAVKIAQSDPFLQSGGTIRVHQMLER